MGAEFIITVAYSQLMADKSEEIQHFEVVGFIMIMEHLILKEEQLVKILPLVTAEVLIMSQVL